MVASSGAATRHRVRGLLSECQRVDYHYHEIGGDGPVLVLLPGLSASGNFFYGVVQAGLSPAFRVLAIDLRGGSRIAFRSPFAQGAVSGQDRGLQC